LVGAEVILERVRVRQPGRSSDELGERENAALAQPRAAETLDPP